MKSQNFCTAYFVIFYALNFVPRDGREANGALNTCRRNFHFIRRENNNKSRQAHHAKKNQQNNMPNPGRKQTVFQAYLSCRLGQKIRRKSKPYTNKSKQENKYPVKKSRFNNKFFGVIHKNLKNPALLLARRDYRYRSYLRFLANASLAAACAAAKRAIGTRNGEQET